MEIIEDIDQFHQRCKELRGEGKRIGLVPTMGCLHEGHLSLVRAAKKDCDVVLLSIFVNPLQFGPSEDLDAYPRPFERDRQLCEEEGVAVIFHPQVADFYPPGFQSTVTLGAITEGLCGAKRPGHFDGVTTILTKLFNLVGPCRAYFGEKDYQQLQVVKRLVMDLYLPTTIIGCPIVREADGLAMSSRNTYLNDTERKAATGIHRALKEGALKAREPGMNAGDLLQWISQSIESDPLLRIEYLEICHRETLEPLGDLRLDESVLLTVVQVGKARLLDNIYL